MAVILEWNGKNILHCKNAIVNVLHESLTNAIEEKKFVLSNSLQEVIDKLEVAGLGIVFDLAEYIKTREDYLNFLSLLNEFIQKKTCLLTKMFIKYLITFIRN